MKKFPLRLPSFRYFWEILLMITYVTAFILIPYDVAFNYGRRRLQTSIIISLIASIGKSITKRTLRTTRDHAVEICRCNLPDGHRN